MNKLHRYRTLSYARSHSLHRTVAYIAHGKNPGNVSFEQEWVPVEGPTLGVLAVPDKVGTGQNEATFVAFHYTRKPIGARQGSDEYEHCAGGHALDLVRVRAEHGNLFEMRIAMRLDHAGVGPQPDVGCLFNLVYQIL